MKILVLSNLYPPNAIGGYERLCFETACALSARNHQIYVLTSNYGGLSKDYPGQHIDRSLQLLADEHDIYNPYEALETEKKEINEKNINVLKQKLEAIQPDILFVWNLYFFDTSFLHAIQRMRCRAVFLLTDNWLMLCFNPTFWARYYKGVIQNSVPWKATVLEIIGKFQNWIHPHLFHIHAEAIFPSRFMKSLYGQSGFRFIDTGVIPHGVRLPSPADSAYRNRSGLVAMDSIRLLFAGRVVEVKGVHTILEALPKIIRSLPEKRIHLTILGDCRDRSFMQKVSALIDRHSLRENVRFQSMVMESELFAIFQDYDIFLFPSLYEPFSLTLIHALASGIPVVASNAGGNREIICHGRNGLLFSVGDVGGLSGAVLMLVEQPELRKTISEQARFESREYSFDNMLNGIENYLRR